MIELSHCQVNSIIELSPEGRNTRFLRASDSLWKRFGNYEKQPPLGLEVNGQIVSIIFATFNKNLYTNLYEIVTMQGQEGNGYASKIWDGYIDFAFNFKGSRRLKMSCTPSSVTWHKRNGLLFWAVDRTGSLRSDQVLFPTRNEQLQYQKFAIKNPTLALPPPKVSEQFRQEQVCVEGLGYAFSEKKKQKVLDAIDDVGEYWLAQAL